MHHTFRPSPYKIVDMFEIRVVYHLQRGNRWWIDVIKRLVTWKWTRHCILWLDFICCGIADKNELLLNATCYVIRDIPTFCCLHFFLPIWNYLFRFDLKLRILVLFAAEELFSTFINRIYHFVTMSLRWSRICARFRYFTYFRNNTYVRKCICLC